MLKPSTVQRNACLDRHNSSNDYGYAIFGDTVSAVLQAYRLVQNGVTHPIYLILDGGNDTTLSDIESTCFVVKNLKIMNRFSNCQKVHYVPSHDNFCHDDDEYQHFVNLINNFHNPSGLLADFIDAYYLPEVGPWFRFSDPGLLSDFLEKYTLTQCLNPVEEIVSDRLASKLKLEKTDCPRVDRGSIMDKHRFFVHHCGCDKKRQLFLNKYAYVKHFENFKVFCNVKCVRFNEPSNHSSGVYNLQISGGCCPVELENVRPIWMTNHFTKLIREGEGGILCGERKIPSYYRGIYPVPIVNGGGVDISTLPVRHDLLTTSLTFSSGDLCNPDCCEPCWLAQVYTTREDTSSLSCSSRFESSTHTLLVVEALNLCNKRQVRYNNCSDELVVQLNEKFAERKWIKQFAKLFAHVHDSYTGGSLNPDVLIGDKDAPVDNHYLEHQYISIHPHRQSPMVSVIETGANLFGSHYYPAANDCLC